MKTINSKKVVEEVCEGHLSTIVGGGNGNGNELPDLKSFFRFGDNGNGSVLPIRLCSNGSGNELPLK